MSYYRKFGPVVCMALFTAIMAGIPCHSAGLPEGVEKDETGYYYTVKKGDTLWDLSQKFFNSAFLWPEMWKENSDAPIPNPHLIYPGQKIRLVPRKGAAFGDLDAEGYAPVLPLPPDGAGQPGEPVLEPAFLRKRKTTHINYTLIDRVGFIKKNPIDPIASIFESKDDKTMISEGDTVYIKELGIKPVILGKHYTIYRKVKLIKDSETREIVGSQYHILGIAEIIKLESKFAVAKVVRSFRSIHVGDYVMPYVRKSPKIEFADSRNLKGKIIGSDDFEEYLGEYSVAFINKGEDHGVALGQEYVVFYQEEAIIEPVTQETVKLTPVEYARFVVLHTEPTTSTILITNSEKQVHIGSEFRSLIQ